MYIKLNNNSFVRTNEEQGYIFNQITKKELYFNDTGAVFLNYLKKETQEIDTIISNIANYYDIDKEIIEEDFWEFAINLQKEGFISITETKEQAINNEPIFSYSQDKHEKTDIEINSHNYNSSEKPSDFERSVFKLENLFLEVTRRCNERCLHCYIPNSQKQHGLVMSFDNAKKHIDQARQMNVLQLTITGGEPFLNPQIEKILEYAREKDFVVSILSNLTLLTENHINLLRKILPSQIQVSLYSMNPEVHDEITQLKGSFDKTMKGLNLCIENDVPVQVSCPIIEQNKNSYKSVLDWAKKNRIKANTEVNIMAQTDNTKTNLVNVLSREELKIVFAELIEYDPEWKRSIIETYTSEKFNTIKPESHVCGAGEHTLFISADNKVFPCSTWQSMELGNLNKNSLREIYEDSEQIKIVRNLKNKVYPNYLYSDFSNFIKVCPAHNANSNNGEYMIIPDTVFLDAEIKKEAAQEFINKLKNKD